jgi:hypothetical protein
MIFMPGKIRLGKLIKNAFNASSIDSKRTKIREAILNQLKPSTPAPTVDLSSYARGLNKLLKEIKEARLDYAEEYLAKGDTQISDLIRDIKDDVVGIKIFKNKKNSSEKQVYIENFDIMNKSPKVRKKLNAMYTYVTGKTVKINQSITYMKELLKRVFSLVNDGITVDNLPDFFEKTEDLMSSIGALDFNSQESNTIINEDLQAQDEQEITDELGESLQLELPTGYSQGISDDFSTFNHLGENNYDS